MFCWGHSLSMPRFLPHRIRWNDLHSLRLYIFILFCHSWARALDEAFCGRKKNATYVCVCMYECICKYTYFFNVVCICDCMTFLPSLLLLLLLWCCLITHSHTCKKNCWILNENSCLTFIFIPFHFSVFMFNLFPFALIFFIYYLSVWFLRFCFSFIHSYAHSSSPSLSLPFIIIIMKWIGIHKHNNNNNTNIVHVLWFFKFFSVSKFIFRSLSQCVC